MSTTNIQDIARMGPDRRLREVAAILAQGLRRARAKSAFPPLTACVESKFSLGYSGEQRVHANPSTTLGERT